MLDEMNKKELKAEMKRRHMTQYSNLDLKDLRTKLKKEVNSQRVLAMKVMKKNVGGEVKDEEIEIEEVVESEGKAAKSEEAFKDEEIECDEECKTFRDEEMKIEEVVEIEMKIDNEEIKVEYNEAVEIESEDENIFTDKEIESNEEIKARVRAKDEEIDLDFYEIVECQEAIKDEECEDEKSEMKK